jgi:GH24 family phage-related lysozyme (muramidase)
MSWEIFKQNVLRVANNPQSIDDIDIVAETYANEYDAAVKRGGDTVNLVSVKTGNVEAMKQIFKAALQKGLTSNVPYDLVGEMGKGVVAYWTGATLNEFPIPVIPAIGAAQNISVTTNIVINPGTWAPVLTSPSAQFQLTPEKRAEYVKELEEESAKLVEAKLVEPPEILVAREDKVSNLVGVLLENEEYRETIPYTQPIATSGRTSVTATGTEVSQEDDELTEEFDLSGDGKDIPRTFPTFPPPPPPPSQGDGGTYTGGATVPLGKLSVKTGGLTINVGESIGLTREEFLKKLNFADGLTISGVDMSRDWAVIASQYISKKEGFTESSSWDENAYRLGYGTNKILDNGNLRDVRPDKAYYNRTGEKKPLTGGDRTTQVDALKVLEMEIRTTYRDKVVGTGDAKITEADWNALNDRQRAGLVSFVYNCGSFGFHPHIPAAIRAKNYIEAASGILNGPISGKNTKTGFISVYSGLIRRRAEEAGIFAYGL